MDALLDSSDLCCDRGVLAGKNIEAEPCGRGYPTILLVSNDLEQLGCGREYGLPPDPGRTAPSIWPDVIYGRHNSLLQTAKQIASCRMLSNVRRSGTNS